MSDSRDPMNHIDDEPQRKEAASQEIKQESKSQIDPSINKNMQLAAIYYLKGEFNIAAQHIKEALEVKPTPESLLLQFNIHFALGDFPGHTYESLEDASKLESKSPTIHHYMCWNQLASYRKKTLAKLPDPYRFSNLCSHSVNELEDSVLKDSFRFLDCLGVLIHEHYSPLASKPDGFSVCYEKYAKQSSRFNNEYKTKFDTIINVRNNLSINNDPPFTFVDKAPLVEVVNTFLEQEWKLISLYSFSHTLVKNSLLEKPPGDFDKVKIADIAFNSFFNQLNSHEQHLLVQSSDAGILELLSHEYLKMRTLELKEKQMPINLNKITKMKNLLSLVVDVEDPQFQILAGQLGWYIYNNQNIDDKNEKLSNLQDAFLLFSQALFSNKTETKPFNIDLNNQDITHFIFYIFDSLKREFLKTEATSGLRGEIDLSTLKLNKDDFIVLNQILTQLKNTFGIQVSESDFLDFMTAKHMEESKSEVLGVDVDYIEKPISLMDFIIFLKKCFLDMKKNPSEIFLSKFKNRIDDLADSVPIALALLQPGQGVNLKNELKQFLPVEEPLQRSTVTSSSIFKPKLVEIKKGNFLCATIPFKYPEVQPGFEVGYALQGKDSFFDSAVQAIYQVTYDSRGFIQKLQDLGMDPKEIEDKLSNVPYELRAAKLFRMICTQYALQKVKDKDSNWLKQYIEAELVKSGESLEDYLKKMESVQSELSENIHSSKSSTEGRPEIEGRILCDVFQIKINVIKSDQEGQLKRQVFEEESVTFPFGMPKFKMINLGYNDGQFVPVLKPSHFNIDKEVSIELESLIEKNQSTSGARRPT